LHDFLHDGRYAVKETQQTTSLFSSSKHRAPTLGTHSTREGGGRMRKMLLACILAIGALSASPGCATLALAQTPPKPLQGRVEQTLLDASIAANPQNDCLFGETRVPAPYNVPIYIRVSAFTHPIRNAPLPLVENAQNPERKEMGTFRALDGIVEVGETTRTVTITRLYFNRQQPSGAETVVPPPNYEDVNLVINDLTKGPCSQKANKTARKSKKTAPRTQSYGPQSNPATACAKLAPSAGLNPFGSGYDQEPLIAQRTPAFMECMRRANGLRQ
jgi:hypothetical protein